MHNWKMILTIGVIIAGVVFAYAHAQTGVRESYHKEYLFNLAAIEEIRIDGVDAQINLIPIEGNEIKVDISGALTQNQEPIAAEQQGSQLKIARPNDRFHFFSFRLPGKGDVINVYVNPNYNKDIHIDAVSGAVSIQSLQARKLRVQNVSGAIALGEIACDTAKLETISGRISARSLVAAQSNVSSTSGSIELRGNVGNLKGNSISGKIDVEYANFDHDIKLNNISGSIILQLGGAGDFKLSTSSVSGRLTNEFESTLLGSGKNTIRLETISGRMTVKK